MYNYKIWQWDDIKDKFDDTILLGNGSSIAISENFKYKSLFEYAKSNNLLIGETEQLFKKFETDDFEFILRILSQTNEVNKILNIDDRLTIKRYSELRESFINTIQKIHPKYEEVENKLLNINKFLRKFRNIVSLNYDLILYWSIMSDKKYFDDGFRRKNDKIVFNLEKLLSSQQIKVCYPHGNLFLGKEIFNTNEIKIISDENNLLNSIEEKWDSTHSIPLFVSEGTSNKKLNYIYNSPYLSKVYHKILPKSKKSLTIYGWSIGKNDTHILEMILDFFVNYKFNTLPKIAISILIDENNDYKNYYDKIYRIFNTTFKNKEVYIYFFDSKSKNCWIW